jgi:uncharacterized protein with von Willebrand factor type A (vWA) domain
MLHDNNINMADDFGFVLNALDDVWQEMITARGYAGAAADLDFCQAYHCKGTVEAIKQGRKPVEHGARVMNLMYKARAEWQRDVSIEQPALESYYHTPEWDKLIPRINGMIDHPDPARELLAIAMEMYDLDPESDKSGQEALEQNQQATEQQEQQAGEGEDKSEGSDKSEGEGEGEDQEGTIKYSDLLVHSHSKSERDGHSSAALRIIYDHEAQLDYDPWPMDKIYHGDPRQYGGYSLGNRYANNIRSLYTSHRNMSAKLRRLFQSASQRKREYQKQRGKLTTKHLPRILNGDNRIFNKTVERVDDTADVYLLCDGSGSMGGDKYPTMAAAVLSLSEALSAAKVSNKVVVFTDDYDMCFHHVIKDWDARPDIDDMIDRFGAVSMGSNADGDNIFQALRDFKARNSKRKILIVLSDGQPASCRDGDCYTFTREAVKKCSQLGVECYGIGIMDYTVKHIYPEHSVLSKPEDIEACLSEVIKSKILRG